MSILNRALLRELTTTTLAVAFIFVALFMVVSLVKILAKAAAGSFPAKLVFTLLGLQTVEILSLMLPLAFYIGLLLTFGRWYRDNEMTVLAACGVGLTQLLRPVLLIAAGFAAVVTLLAFISRRWRRAWYRKSNRTTAPATRRRRLLPVCSTKSSAATKPAKVEFITLRIWAPVA